MADEIADPIKDLAKSLIIDTIKEWYSYIKSYNDNMKELRDEYNNLVSLNNTFSNMVEQRKQQNLHKSTPVTDGWLAKVHNLVEKDENLTHLIDEKTRKGKDQCCFGRVNCNLYRRYEMSKIAQIKVDEIKKVIKDKPDESMITEPRTDLIPTPNEFMLALSSRVELMEIILKKLRDDYVNVVGIFGMGAIGKTTLAKEIANKGAKDMFEKIVMVEISVSPNVERIQDQIAEQLNLKLDGLHSIEKRAVRLYNTLIRYPKVLVILDNLWKNLDLREVGIPQPNVKTQQNYRKLLVTSRMKDVCEVVGASLDNILEVHPLNENEAWLLFRARVGDKANDDSSLKEKMLNKCGGLPLLILALADVLKNSREQLLDNVLRKLQDDQVEFVAIYGEEAVGKTTLAKEIAKKGAKNMLFGKIVMVEISRTPNVEHIQDQIADQLTLKLNNKHCIEKRANFLFTSLKRRNTNKILVILDNLCEKFDLEKVGILQHNNNTQQFCCKLLVTSTKRNVCEVMGVSMPNIFEVCPLEDNEARQLLRERIGANADDRLRGQEEMEKKMLNKCGGMPLAIVALAYVLKGQELSTWEHFATELEKPISISQAKISGLNPQTYSILQTSYKFMVREEKRRFLLLACLFPFGARIPVEEMMRYGIGLGLFQQFDNLNEAMKQANTWFDELKSSALLLEDGSEDYAKIHDVVRASIISLAEKDGHGDMVMEEAFPQTSLDTFQKCYAISGIDHSQLNNLNSDKLQILILNKSKHGDHFPDNFFEGMSNLKVLVLKGMDFTPGLPNSMRKLKKSLRTLLLEECKLGDITTIVELTNLDVLSLRWSIMEELPEKIGDLCNLRLLDLNGCMISKKGLSANVLSNLSWLEGLYTLSPSWRFDDSDNNSEGGEYARNAELNKFRYLKVLSANLIFEDWPIHNELEFVENLDQFHICAGRTRLGSKKYSRSRSLELSHIKNLRSSCVAYNSLRVLLEKSQLLMVKFMWELQHIFDDTHQQEDGTKVQSSVLEYPHLQHLMVRLCPKMHSISSTPFAAPNLTELSVSTCDNMKFIFLEHARQGNICIVRFPGLKRMSLEYLPKMESLTGITKRSTTANKARHQILFNKKMIFPSLEHLVLRNCGRIEKLWEVKCKEMIYYFSFKNLRTLEITRCDKLEVLGLLSIAIALEQLEHLSIDKCSQLRKIISQEEEEEEERRDLKYGCEIFPFLESVRLKDCPKLKMFISGRNLKDRFSKLLLLSLQKLDINKCPQMKFFSLGPSFMAPKLNQIEFDCVLYPMDETNKYDINTAFVKNCTATNLSEDINEE